MYDKVKLWIPRTRATPDILQYLDTGSEIVDLTTGEKRVYGCINNLKVSIYTSGISINGSLAKYLYHGSNIYPLDRKTTENAINGISDRLHIDVAEAKVTALEIGANFTMKHPPFEYIRRLGEMPRMDRISIKGTSLYYKGKGRQQPKVFTFYDKGAESIAKGMDKLGLDNILRYEMRLKGRLSQQIRCSEVMALTLYDRTFYKNMVNMYQPSYFSISKSNQLKTDVMDEIKTPKDAFEVFVARLINQGDRGQIKEYLEELKSNNVFKDKKDYTRVKAKMEAISKKANITISDELIKELDDEIKNFGAYV